MDNKIGIRADNDIRQPTAPSGRAFRSRSQWRLVPGEARQVKVARPRFWSHYERLIFVLLGWMWVALLSITLLLHVGNYGLETKTSSTSGTHSDFYDLKGVGQDALAPDADGKEPNDAQP